MSDGNSRSKQTLALVAIALLTAILIVAAQTRKTNSSDATVEGDASLWYCSSDSDAQCQAGVAAIEVEFVGRNPSFAALYGYPSPDRIKVSLQEIAIRLNTRADLVFDEEEEVFLYTDADNSGDLSDGDTKVARGLLKAKRIVFEDLNRVVESEGESSQPSLSIRMFVVRSVGGYEDVVLSDDTEEIRLPLFKTLEVKARDVNAGYQFVKTPGAVADRSLFANLGSVQLSRDETLLLHPGLVAGSQPNEILLGPGTFTISEDLLIAEGLRFRVMPGTRLLLAKGKSLVSYSPMEMVGQEDDPIRISNLEDEPFGVVASIGSVGSDAETVLRYVHVSGGSQASINGAFLSGMVSIYRNARVIVEDSTFADAKADDALNIKYAEVQINGNRFTDNLADAIDGDFVIGSFEDNYFGDNGNDSLDFSGSDVEVRNNRISSSGDKCISIGEASIVLVTRNVLRDCEIGVEIKDASDAVIVENLITGARSWAINAYVKKPFFGTPSFDVTDNVLLGNIELYGNLATTIDPEANITEGDQQALEQEVPWMASMLSTAPTN